MFIAYGAAAPTMIHAPDTQSKTSCKCTAAAAAAAAASVKSAARACQRSRRTRKLIFDPFPVRNLHTKVTDHTVAVARDNGEATSLDESGMTGDARACMSLEEAIPTLKV